MFQVRRVLRIAVQLKCVKIRHSSSKIISYQKFAIRGMKRVLTIFKFNAKIRKTQFIPRVLYLSLIQVPL